MEMKEILSIQTFCQMKNQLGSHSHLIDCHDEKFDKQEQVNTSVKEIIHSLKQDNQA